MSDQEKFPRKEVVDILSQWSKRAMVKCLEHNGADLNLSNNQQLNSSLDQCVNEVIGELFSIVQEHYHDSSSNRQRSETC